ncbi:MAG: succinate dehydrogenase, hydrophobic membrane anchor protein [Pseudomonadota bacterium]|nr:succinate dehydrogenase, hydrophobic membrane anchor protein [Pseudomonadota bacterium]
MSATRHWWRQRLTAFFLIPLGIWLIASLVALADADCAMIRLWLSRPLVASLMALTLVLGAWHGALGVRVVIEDYVPGHGLQRGLIAFSNCIMSLVASAALLAILVVAMEG